MEFAEALRARYADAGRCTCVVAGSGRPPESVSVRLMNFGQHWRTEGIVDVPYRVELPRAFLLDLLRERLPDFLDDSRRFPDPDSAYDRALEAAGWPEVEAALHNTELLPLFARFYAHDLLLHWFGDVEPQVAPGFVLNTIDSIDLAAGGGVIALSGTAREAGMAVRYQDR